MAPRVERRRGDRVVIGLLAVVLLVQLLQGIELHDRVFDIDAAADELIVGVPRYTEAAKELLEFALVLGGLAAAVRELWRGPRRRNNGG